MRANLKWKLVSQVVGSCLVLLLAIGMSSCDQSTATMTSKSVNIEANTALMTTDGPLAEVNIPASIAKLAPSVDNFQPQVQILSPQPDELLTDDRVTVKLQVNDLPIFKSAELGLGNHLHLILDKQTYKGVYDLTKPVVFENLAAGTHTLRVFASRPWHESFKNEGAYAQTTFHILTKTAENNPNPQQPLLTYSRPTGTYGAEPIMLDYYLTNAPSHLVANGSPDSLPDWRIRATVNNQQFIIDRWTPIYLQGFKQGKNWVRLELVDDRGNPIPNVYNDSVSIVTYDPQTKDSLAKLIRGEIKPNLARSLVDPNYVAPKPAPAPVVIPTPAIEPTPAPTPAIIAPQPSPIVIAAPTPNPIASPTPIPSPILIPTPPAIVESPETRANQPDILPSPAPIQTIPTQNPISIPQPTPLETPAPAAVKIPIQPSPEPIAMPSPVATPATSISRPSIPIPTPQITIAPPAIPSPAMVSPPVAAEEENTWQSQAIELIKIAGVKTRAFTNTIPAKAQRFGHNVQIWAGNAMDTIQSWRDK